MISSISLFENIDTVMPDWKTFFWIAAFVADSTAFNPSGTKMFLAYGVSTFLINGKTSLANRARKVT